MRAAGTSSQRALHRILGALHGQGPQTRRELVERCGLSRPTVDKAVKLLLAHHLVEADGYRLSSGGRRAAQYRINPVARYVVGVDLEMPGLTIVVAGLDGEPLHQRTLEAFDCEQPEPTVRALGEEVRRLLRRARVAPADVLGVGVGLPAFLVGERVTVAGSTLPAWERVPLVGWLQEALDAPVPVQVDNDANYMALAESQHRPTDPVMVYVALRAGLRGDIRLGGAVLLEGKPYRGAHGNAASLQKAWFDLRRPDELIEALERALARTSSAAEGAQVLEEHLVLPILNLITLFDPTRVVINAEILGEAEPLFIQACRRAIAARLNREPWSAQVEPARVRRMACAQGAALAVIQEAFSRPQRWLSPLVMGPERSSTKEGGGSG